MSEELVQNQRLLSLEQSVRDIAASTGRIEAHQEQVIATLASVGRKIDAQDARIAPLEKAEQSRSERNSRIKKLVLPAIAALAGVFGASLGHKIVAALGVLLAKQ